MDVTYPTGGEAVGWHTTSDYTFRHIDAFVVTLEEYTIMKQREDFANKTSLFNLALLALLLIITVLMIVTGI
jgi:hypothetical protein